MRFGPASLRRCLVSSSRHFPSQAEATDNKIDWNCVEHCCQCLTELLISGKVTISVPSKGKAAEPKDVEIRRADKLLEKLDVILKSKHSVEGEGGEGEDGAEQAEEEEQDVTDVTDVAPRTPTKPVGDTEETEVPVGEEEKERSKREAWLSEICLQAKQTGSLVKR